MGRDVEKSQRRCLTFPQTESIVSSMGTKKPRMGRPPKPPAEKMDCRVTVRLTPGQYRHLVAKATEAKLSLSAFIQMRLEG